MKKIIILSFAFFAFQSAASAAVHIVNRTATLKVSQSDGSSVTLEPNDVVSEIVDGSVIEALAPIDNDSVSADIAVDGQTVHMTKGDAIAITPSVAPGFEVLKGKVSVTTPRGLVKIYGAPSGNDTYVNQPSVVTAVTTGDNSYVAPMIPNPQMAEQQIEADEAVQDISPIRSL